MSFTYELVVRGSGGAVQTLSVSASDSTDARARAARQGFHVLTCVHPPSGTAEKPAPRATSRRHGFDITNFAYELSSLLAAGLSVLEALRTLSDKEAVPIRRQMILDLMKEVSEGLPLSAALEKQPGIYPPLLVATVSASEQTGDLGTSLLRYAEHQQGFRVLRDKVTGAAIYPMLLLAVGCLVIFFLLAVVVPKFAVLIESTRKELPWTSALMISWGRFAAAHAWGIGAVTVAGAVGLALFARRTFQRGARSRWIEALPFMGGLIRKFRHAQLYRTTGMLVRGGISAPRALQLAASLLGDADAQRLARALRLIHEGKGISAALKEAQIADPVASSMLSVAERTGALSEILERIAQFHEAGLQRSVELTSRLFEPVLMIVIGLVIGAIVVLMYLPIFDLASSLQ